MKTTILTTFLVLFTIFSRGQKIDRYIAMDYMDRLRGGTFFDRFKFTPELTDFEKNTSKEHVDSVLKSMEYQYHWRKYYGMKAYGGGVVDSFMVFIPKENLEDFKIPINWSLHRNVGKTKNKLVDYYYFLTP